MPILAALLLAASLPPAVVARLPAGHRILRHVRVAAAGRTFDVIALARRGESRDTAPPRPLLIVDRRSGTVVRNDHVVMRADEGGQCDPFLDGDATIETAPARFTVENGVACGQHWTVRTTFRFDARTGGFVFDREHMESWRMGDDPDGEALVPDGPPHATRADPRRPVTFARWRR